MMLSLVWAALSLLPGLALAKEWQASDLITLLGTTAEQVSVAGGLDLPKLSPLLQGRLPTIASSEASVTVVFFNSGLLGFEIFDLVAPFSVMVTGTLPNGQIWADLVVPAPSGMYMNSTAADGVYCEFRGSGASFRGTPLTAGQVQYVVDLNMPNRGITGKITLNSRAPAHYACGPNTAGVSQAITPQVYWANAVPDAQATVDINVYGNRVQFTDGVGYHDKNWGVATFGLVVQNWYWGHAYLAPYSAVWFDAVNNTGKEYFSGYLVKDGKVIASGCADKSAVARPWGTNSVYPPTELAGVPQGLAITFQTPQGPFVVNATTTTVAIDILVYRRVLANVTGGFVGGNQASGRAQWEQFQIL